MNSVIVAGWFLDSMDFGDGVLITTNGATDAFVCKHDNDGNFKWVQSWGGGNDYDYGWSVAVDSSNDVYVSGQFNGTVDFGDGNPIFSWDNPSACLCKYSSDGDFTWVRTYGELNQVWDRGYAVDVSTDGSVYMAGYTSNNNGFLIKYDINSTQHWVKSAGGPVLHNSITVDDSAGIFIGGEFSGTVDFGDGNSIPSNGDKDVYLLKLLDN